MSNHGLWAPMLSLGIPITLAVIGYLYFRAHERRPSTPVVVVDRRTFRLAQRRLAKLEELGEYARARSALAAMEAWLRREIHTGPTRRRVWCARQLELVELRTEQIRATVYPDRPRSS